MKRFIVIFAAAALALGVVNPASANFIYDLTGISGHQQFETASVLTSSTLITSFTINTSPTYTVLALGPDRATRARTRQRASSTRALA